MPPTQHPFVVATIDDLGQRACLYAQCERCGHSGRLDLHELRECYGPIALTDLRTRICCSVCGADLYRVLQVWDCRKGEALDT